MRNLHKHLLLELFLDGHVESHNTFLIFCHIIRIIKIQSDSKLIVFVLWGYQDRSNSKPQSIRSTNEIHFPRVFSFTDFFSCSSERPSSPYSKNRHLWPHNPLELDQPRTPLLRSL